MWKDASIEKPISKPDQIKRVLTDSNMGYRIGFYVEAESYWFDDDECHIDDCEYCNDDNNDGSSHYLPEGWWQEIDDHYTCAGCIIPINNVTHWQELPKLPK